MSTDDRCNVNIWGRYIEGKLSSAEERKLEELLLKDEGAVHQYMKELELLEDSLPLLSDRDLFSDGVISALPSIGKSAGPDSKGNSKAKANRWNLPIVHYLIAASITLLLLGSGVFDLLSIEANQSVHKARNVSISDQWMNATSKWIDSIKDNSSKK
ncbi:hypothetical protein D3C76_183020 [compost metagenome]